MNLLINRHDLPVVPPCLVLFAAVTRSPRPDQEVVFAGSTQPMRFQPPTHLSVKPFHQGTLLRHLRRCIKYSPLSPFCQALFPEAGALPLHPAQGRCAPENPLLGVCCLTFPLV